MLIFEDKIPQSIRKAFTDKVIAGSTTQQYDPNWLMVVMNSESQFNPAIINISCQQAGGSVDTCATGLIQFMPSTAKSLGTTTRSLQAMDAVKQLDYVFKYYEPYKNKITRFYDLYLATFYPVAVGKPDTWEFPFSENTYLMNRGIDMNKDGKITIAEFKQFALKKIPTEYRSQFENEGMGLVVDAEKFAKRNWIPLSVLAGAAFVAAIVMSNSNSSTKQAA